MSELAKLRDELRKFAAERDWDQFHSPKNLASALAVEAAELLEPFQWLTEEQSRKLDEKQRAAVADEIADVQIYLIRLADKLAGSDLVNATQGFERLAKTTATPSKSLHRMLSPKGNPSMDNLAAIFDAIRKFLKVGLKVHTVNLQKVA